MNKERMKDVASIVVTGVVIISIVVMSFNMTRTRNSDGIANQVASVRNTVVHIEKDGECQGSGCIITSDGIIFTAKHVTDGGGKFTITLDNGDKYHTQRCIESTEFDVAFLKIEPNEPLEYASLSPLTNMRVGDPVFIMGSPFGKDNFNSVSLGILSYMQRDLDGEKPYGYGWKVTFQTDATAEPGNSGGPVFDISGRVIGVLVAGMDATVNYSVPVGVFTEDTDMVKLWFELAKFKIPEPPVVFPDYSAEFSSLQTQIDDLLTLILIGECYAP